MIGQTGLAIAGDVSFNLVVEDVQAIISDGGSLITASMLDIGGTIQVINGGEVSLRPDT